LPSTAPCPLTAHTERATLLETRDQVRPCTSFLPQQGKVLVWDMRTKTLWIRAEYLDQVLSGHKTIEVRVAYSNIARLEPGDRLLLNGAHPFVIRRMGRYASFEDLLAHEDPASIAPGMSRQALLSALRQLYPPEKEALGAIALEIEPAQEPKS
jgi:ASC-1-like (ASCH) protein